MVLLFGLVSNQSAIRRVKEQIGAALLEVVLFRRDVRVSLSAQMSLLWAGTRYFLLAIAPVLILAVPFSLVLGHVNLRLGSRPLSPGEQGILAVSVKKGTDLQSVVLSRVDGLSVVGPVRVPKTSSIYWRLSPEQVGRMKLDIHAGSAAEIQQDLIAGTPTDTEPAGIFLTKTDVLSQLLFPNGGAAQTIPPGPFESIELTYPQRSYSLCGLEMSWLTAFLVISIIAGYVGSKLFGVSV